MAVNINDINAVYWSAKLDEHGEIVTDADDIAQCIAIILQTPKGTDPLRPEFGCNIIDYIDQPINEARAGIVAEVISALNTWETRIEIDSVTVVLEDNSTIIISVSWLLTAGDALETTEVII